jgi:hypothetical protein
MFWVLESLEARDGDHGIAVTSRIIERIKSRTGWLSRLIAFLSTATITLSTSPLYP